MNRLMKWLVGLLGVIVVLALLTVFLLPLVVDGDALKTRISEQVKSETGRTVAVDGDLGFSIFPNLAVDLERVRVGEAGNPNDQPVGTIREARVSVALFPLLKQELVVHGLTLEGGDLEYRDEAGGAHYGLRDLTVQTGALVLGEIGPSAPVDLDISTVLEDLVAGTTTQLDFTTVATLDVSVDNYVLEDLTLEAQPDQAGTPVRLETPRLMINLAEQTAVMDTFSLNKGPLEVSGAARVRELLGKPSFDARIEAPAFSPRAVMADLDMDPVATADPAVLGRATLSAQLTGDAGRVDINELDLVLDDSRMSGKMTIVDPAAPAVRFDLVIDSIDLDRYMPPAEEAPAPGDAGPVVIPAADLGAQDIEGTLRIGRLTTMGVDLNDAEVGLRAKDGVTRVHPLTAGFFGGVYRGDIRLDSRGEVPKISFDEKLEAVLFEQMAADLFGYEDLTGVALGEFKAEGTGITADQVLETLQGAFRLSLDEGALEGIDIWYEIRKGLATIKGKPAPEGDQGRTVFTRLLLDASLADGVISTNQLQGQLPFLDLDGDGSVNILDRSIDLGLTAAVRDVPELDAEPLAADLRGRRFPLRISGGLFDPAVAVDVESLLKDEATDLLFDRLGLSGDSEDGGSTDEDETIDAARGLLKGLLGGDKQDPDKDDDSGGGGDG